MRKALIIANWKMNTTLADATVLITSVKNAVRDIDADIVLCPPFTWLVPLAEILEGAPNNLNLGAQNMWFGEKGAMTGEISPLMLKDLVKFVILGHSERRLHFGESDDLINDKIQAALSHKITPVVCVGENKKMNEEKSRGQTEDIDLKSGIITQLKGAFEGISHENAEKIVVAYEPVWAIGTGRAATGAYAASVATRLREVLAKKYGQTLSEEIRLLYGGSVDAGNIAEFILQPSLDGVLVGGASLKVKEFLEICRKAVGRG